MTAPYVERLELIDDMFAFGIQAYRQRMRRENPTACEEELDSLVQAWLLQPSDLLGNSIHLPARA